MPREYTLNTTNSNQTLNDPVYERDYRILCKNYLKADFTFDVIANMPIFFYDMLSGYPTGEEEMEERRELLIYQIFWCLKFIRFVHANDIRDSLVQIKDVLSDKFISKRLLLNNILHWSITLTKFVLTVHILTCLWLGIK